MDIGEAVKALKNGEFVAREGWNGKGMFLWLKKGTVIHQDWCKDHVLWDICEANGGKVEGTGTVCMYTAQHTVLTGWLASQTDLLATDWVIVDNPFKDQ